MKISAEFSLDFNFSPEYYFIRSKEPLGGHPCISIPQKFTNIPLRILHHYYFLNCYSPSNGHSFIQFNAPQGHFFIELELEAEQSIVFKPNSLIGFSSSIHLGRYISLQVSTLSLGEIFFPYATGPGKLYFETIGKPTICDIQHKNLSFSFTRLVAWDKSIVFNVKSSSKILDILFSDQYLEPFSSGLILLDSDENKGSSQFSLKRLIKQFLLPI